MNISVRPPEPTSLNGAAPISASLDKADPAAKAREGAATKGLAGRVVRQVFNVAGHATMLAAKGLWKLGEGLVFVARQFAHLVQALHREYQRQHNSSDKPLMARKASRPPNDASTPMRSTSAQTGVDPLHKTPSKPNSDAETAAHRSRRDDQRLAQRIKNLPEPPSSIGSAANRGAYSDFEGSGSKLSGKPLDAKWQRTVDDLQARLDELRKPD